MLLSRQVIPEQAERSIKESAPEMFLPPVQSPGQPDAAYRLVLIDLIAEIDRTKRDIKAQIHSSAILAKEDRVSVDQVWLRRAKDKMDHLTREREEIRKVLHIVNERSKEARRAANRPREAPGFTIDAAFRQVAKARLPHDLYDALMDQAADIAKGDGIQQESGQAP